MKKCKIEVIKTTFHKDLADEYGCKGIGKCPMHKVGEVFLEILLNLKNYVTKHGKQCINMYLLCLMVVKNFTMEIG